MIVLQVAAYKKAVIAIGGQLVVQPDDVGVVLVWARPGKGKALQVEQIPSTGQSIRSGIMFEHRVWIRAVQVRNQRVYAVAIWTWAVAPQFGSILANCAGVSCTTRSGSLGLPTTVNGSGLPGPECWARSWGQRHRRCTDTGGCPDETSRWE